MFLNNVTKVERIIAENLNAERVSLSEVLVSDSNVFTPIHVLTPVNVECISKIEKKEDVYETKMVLRLKKEELWNGATGHYAFRITCVDGTQYLIGMTERPFTKITSSETHPDKVTGAQGKTLTVEYVSSFEMPQIRL